MKTQKNKTKLMLSYLMALTLSTNSIPINIYANEIETKTIEQKYSAEDEDLNQTLNSIYQMQMNYLYETINKLDNFYLEKDNKNIIKNSYSNAFNVTKHEFNCQIISNGTKYKTFIPYNQDLLSLILENNQLIKNLNIKPLGNGRNTDYGMIPDKESQLGFRKKTEEDIKLIDEYTSIIGSNPILENEFINLLIKTPEELSEEQILTGIESIINYQLNYIIKTKNKLAYYYTNIDTKDIIKNSFEDSYKNIKSDINYLYSYNGTDYQIVRNHNLSFNDQIIEYMNIININNNIINSLNIKKLGNGRNTNYGIIPDKKSPLGFRKKTEEDQILIDIYSQNLEDYKIIPTEISNYLQKITKNKSNDKVKKYENK